MCACVSVLCSVASGHLSSVVNLIVVYVRRMSVRPTSPALVFGGRNVESTYVSDGDECVEHAAPERDGKANSVLILYTHEVQNSHISFAGVFHNITYVCSGFSLSANRDVKFTCR